jgi:hypothetical protein
MSDIWVLTITYGPRATQDSLFYKTEARAKDQQNVAFDGGVFEDDFANVVNVLGAIQGVRLSSMEKSLEVQLEQAIMSARSQAAAQRRASADKSITLGGGLPVADQRMLPFQR